MQPLFAVMQARHINATPSSWCDFRCLERKADTSIPSERRKPETTTSFSKLHSFPFSCKFEPAVVNVKQNMSWISICINNYSQVGANTLSLRRLGEFWKSSSSMTACRPDFSETSFVTFDFTFQITDMTLDLCTTSPGRQRSSAGFEPAALFSWGDLISFSTSPASFTFGSVRARLGTDVLETNFRFQGGGENSKSSSSIGLVGIDRC